MDSVIEPVWGGGALAYDYPDVASDVIVETHRESRARVRTHSTATQKTLEASLSTALNAARSWC